MTREELRKEATMTVEWECTPLIDRPLFVHAYITGAEPREKRIAELEKENAELKEQCLILADCNTCNSTCKTENIEMKKQLTKAKEIIKEMLSILPKENIEGVYEITEKAEEFIREAEK